jgi:hypothetical protein
LVKVFILPLEKQISSEQEEKQIPEKETQVIVGQKRRARTDTSSSASNEQMVAAGGTRRSKRVKVAPTRYAPVAEDESWTTSPHASPGIVTMHTTLTASPPLENSIATDETTMNGSNVDTNISSSRRVVAATKTFDERLKELMAFKAECGHCNAPQTQSRNNKYHSLGTWCNDIRRSYKTIKQGGIPRRYNLSKFDIKRLENAGFGWDRRKAAGTCNFDAHFKELMAFKAEFGHCNAPQTQSNKHLSLGIWCKNVRMSYKTNKEGGIPLRYTLSKADIKRLENAGFQWDRRNSNFDAKFKELMAFKAEFGHCNVSLSKSSDKKHYSLGRWSGGIRKAYEIMKEGGIPKGYKLFKADIQRLENAGFEWNLSKRVPFDERFKHLMAFKAEFGHCNVPQTRSRNNKYY